ncbi:MAG: hypothetical protein SVR08_10775 [Spirochaetota bacterium]|nr:hypothetical protein [Spirochaetota bacterium]
MNKKESIILIVVSLIIMGFLYFRYESGSIGKFSTAKPIRPQLIKDNVENRKAVSAILTQKSIEKINIAEKKIIKLNHLKKERFVKLNDTSVNSNIYNNNLSNRIIFNRNSYSQNKIRAWQFQIYISSLPAPLFSSKKERNRFLHSIYRGRSWK